MTYVVKEEREEEGWSGARVVSVVCMNRGWDDKPEGREREEEEEG